VNQWCSWKVSEADRDKWRTLVNAGKLSSGYIIGGLSSSSQFHRVSLVSTKKTFAVIHYA
jgi:hypothetical protein